MTALATNRRIAIAALALVVCFAVISPVGALMLSPAIALLFALGLGLFPDERLILRIRRRLRRSRLHALVPRSGRTTPRVRALRSGRTIAFALAMRPPPARTALSI